MSILPSHLSVYTPRVPAHSLSPFLLSMFLDRVSSVYILYVSWSRALARRAQSPAECQYTACLLLRHRAYDRRAIRHSTATLRYQRTTRQEIYAATGTTAG
ncbi:hypothetical protein PENSPDRAFT_58772 [Peniophora sp. CONT]|nr:hypothetical protein PENSPDRAFT_58772 [Peniophora sp. CONT]